ncbi:MAG: cysteine desulfurase [Monoraphidium minutum]|nr:MAG: cysteine desulfurase [Monoraphidium minutum]
MPSEADGAAVLAADEAPEHAAARRAARAAFAFFDAGRGSPAFMENAGGSQVPRCVADAVRDHLLYDCAQLEAGHEVSTRSTAKVQAAHDTMTAFFGAAGAGHVALGASSSQLLAALASCYARLLGPGDEVVVQEACHEANAGPWVRCAEGSGAALKWWRTDVTPEFAGADGAAGGAGSSNGGAPLGPPLRVSFPCASRLPQLRSLLSHRTRLVAVTHVSNLLGGVADVPALVELVREAAPRARLVVDGVAYAPHLAVDAAGWGVDWYVVSIYKTFGPHLAALYGSAAAFQELAAARGPNHYFIHPSAPSYWFELGGASHEACAGVVAIGGYLRLLAAAKGGAAKGGAAAGGDGAADGAGEAAAAPLSRGVVEAAFGLMSDLEATLAAPIIDLLQAHPRVILIGPGAAPGGGGRHGGDAGWSGRVPTISFVHIEKSSRDVAREVQARGFAIRSGHAYAHRLVRALAPAVLPHLRRTPVAPAPGGAAAGGAAAAQSGATAAQSGAAAPAADAAAAAFVEDGVVRISLLHYNTPGEVAGLVAALREVL